ncbi:MAG: sensor histidine kinase, partial [Ignavibacteriae bacterium]|nr:sensor histidine kinase [Ignavibacteriota bacterium]
LDYFSKKKDVIEINNYSKDEFKNFFEAHEHGIRAITRVSENGKIIFTYPIVESAINAYISKQQHNKEVLENRKPVISEVFTAVQGYKTIAIVCPIFNNGNFKGAISFLVNYENMVNKIISPIAKQKGVNSILISEKGNQIYFSDNDSNIQTNNKLQFDKTVILKSISDKHSENLEHVINFSGTSNNKNQQKQIIFDKVDLGNTFWVVGVIVNISDILKINRGFIWKFASLFFIIGLIVTVLGFLYYRSEKRNAQLLHIKENKYKDELKKLVEIRTAELNELNKSLENDLITRREIEKDLIHAIKKAEQSDRIKSDFLAQISHEIRTPINTIISFSNLIKDELIDKISDELKYGFSGINNAGKRLIRTIDLILNMSDAHAGTSGYTPSKINLATDIIDKILAEYKHQIKEKNLELEFNTKTVDPNITADLYTVEHIFTNLIDNAVKYTNQGKIEIDLLRNEKNNLKVVVKDSGVGISKDYIPKIFDEFSQEDVGYTRRYEGNGLGLALVKKYCEINHAEISVESEKGKGSAFTVTFLESN